MPSSSMKRTPPRSGPIAARRCTRSPCGPAMCCSSPLHHTAVTLPSSTHSVESAGDEPIVLFDRSRADVGDGQPRKTTVLTVVPSEAERRMHDLLDRYSRRVWEEAGRRGDERARLVSILLRKRALSSAGSLAASVERRLALLSRPRLGRTLAVESAARPGCRTKTRSKTMRHRRRSRRRVWPTRSGNAAGSRPSPRPPGSPRSTSARPGSCCGSSRGSREAGHRLHRVPRHARAARATRSRRRASSRGPAWRA